MVWNHARLFSRYSGVYLQHNDQYHAIERTRQLLSFWSNEARALHHDRKNQFLRRENISSMTEILGKSACYRLIGFG